MPSTPQPKIVVAIFAILTTVLISLFPLHIRADEDSNNYEYIPSAKEIGLTNENATGLQELPPAALIPYYHVITGFRLIWGYVIRYFPRVYRMCKRSIIKTINTLQFLQEFGGRPAYYNGHIVITRDKIFAAYLKNQNCFGMKSGSAPIGIDLQKIELHHINQEVDAVLIELTSTEHDIPWLHDKRESEISRPIFDAWRRDYYKNYRHASYCGKP